MGERDNTNPSRSFSLDESYAVIAQWGSKCLRLEEAAEIAEKLAPEPREAAPDEARRYREDAA
jgi:hypothetical protein